MITREEFLKTKLPVIPYCHWHRGVSSTYSERMHVENKNNGIHISFFWCITNKVTASIYYTKEKKPNKRQRYVRMDEFNSGEVEELCLNVFIGKI